MGAVAVDPRRGRRGDAEQVGAEEMDAHRAQRRRPAHHLGGVAHVQRIADIAFGERDLDVAEAFGGGAHRVERRFARPRPRRRRALDPASSVMEVDTTPASASVRNVKEIDACFFINPVSRSTRTGLDCRCVPSVVPDAPDRDRPGILTGALRLTD